VVCRFPINSTATKKVMVVVCSDRSLSLSHVNVDFDNSMAMSKMKLMEDESHVVEHVGISCGQCGQGPIKGVRFSCTVRKR